MFSSKNSRKTVLLPYKTGSKDNNLKKLVFLKFF